MTNALPHLFIDYENLQPPAADFARLRGLESRIWLFHGPHQNRFEADVVSAWQPLGERLRFVQGAKSGKNALDFHIAFALGQAWQQDVAAGIAAHYLVVSKDTGFDALIEHLHGLGAQAARAKSIADALAAASAEAPHAHARAPKSPPTAKVSRKAARAGEEPVPEKKAAAAPEKKAAAAPAAQPAKKSSARATPAAKVSSAKVPAASAPTAKAPAASAPAAQLPPARAPARKSSAGKVATASRSALADGDTDKVIAALRAHPRSRPTDREALLRHIVSVLKHKVSSEVGEAVIRELERQSVLSFTGNKAQYRLPDAASGRGSA